MKKTSLALSLVLSVWTLGAQTMEDAINISGNNYYGTAKSLALGNAVTAIGGDLGMVGINPAASAVNGYSQFTITPGFVVSTTSSSYAPSYIIDHNNPAESGSMVFGKTNSENETKFVMPNIGVSLRFDTGNSSGLKSCSFAFLSNGTAQYNNFRYASGLNGFTTMTGALAAYASADGLPAGVLSDYDRYDGRYNWNQVLAYHGGLINYNRDAGNYFGSAESVSFDGSMYEYGLAGTLYQVSSVEEVGSKNDVLLNLGLNFNDNLFLGVNLGFPIAEYNYREKYIEAAYSGKEDFVVIPEYYGSDGQYHYGPETNFESASYEYVYNSDINGVYLSLGAIWLPIPDLRLGASFRTPTSYTIRENFQSFADADFASGAADAWTDLGENEYCLRSPYTFDVGAAWTFGPFGLVSVDYELNDYHVMRYKLVYEEGHSLDDGFYRVNQINKNFCGVSHSLRIGAEIKPFPNFAIRGGYSFVTDPRRYCTDTFGNTVDAAWYDSYFSDYDSGLARLNDDWKYYDDTVHSFSFGVGFTSRKGFFADAAMRFTAFPDYDFNPYGCYMDGDDLTVVAPTTRTSRKDCDILFTFGWRF